MKKKTKKQIDSEIAAAFKIHFDRVAIPLFDIPKIYNIALQRVEKGQTSDEAVKALVPLYNELEYLK